MTATCKLTKVALRREDGYPIGQTAPLHVVCPCGSKVQHGEAGMECPKCGQQFDRAGWLVAK